ncbi:MAG: CBS domain-containing protein [Gammaproteobacteria bacterium]|nr:CBS domain-containing protein [Gammaproteobacteria bacterium]
MSDDEPETNTSQGDKIRRSWLERISDRLSREPKDRDQLMELLRDAEQRQLLDPYALVMIEGVLEVSEMQVRDVMIPRAQMVVIEHDKSPEDIVPIVVESAHSRFPVIGDNKDEVIGILLAKDLLNYFAAPIKADFNLRDVLRPAVFIPESKRLNMLLREFRTSRNHMAIVVDEYGGVAGLVTIEDVLEEIVGEIEDEHDIDDDANIVKVSDARFTVKGITPIEDFNLEVGAGFSDDEFDTVGGLVTNEFGRVPKRGEAVTFGAFQFKVLRADSRRIQLLQVTRANSVDSAP